MLKSGKKVGFEFVVLLGLISLCIIFFLINFKSDNNNAAPITVSKVRDFHEGKAHDQDSITPIRNGITTTKLEIKEEKNRKNEQKFQGAKKYITFEISKKKPFFKVGPGSVKKLSTEKPEQSNPFDTEVVPSSSDRLPTITVDDESDPAIFFSSQSANDCESQSVIDTLSEIDLLLRKVTVDTIKNADSTDQKP